MVEVVQNIPVSVGCQCVDVDILFSSQVTRTSRKANYLHSLALDGELHNRALSVQVCRPFYIYTAGPFVAECVTLQ